MTRRWNSVFIFAFCMSLGCRAMAAVADSYVVRVESATVYLDWGAKSGVEPGDRFTVYHRGEPLKHPVTGEVLGRSEESLGAGRVKVIESKFTIAELDQILPGLKAGDRARWDSRPSLSVVPVAAAPVAAAGAAGASASGTAVAPSPVVELWRSEPLEKDAVGITFADLDGDGRPEIIVAYLKKIQAYRMKDKKLEPLASYDDRSYKHWLAIDAADLKGEGKLEIFATAYMDGIDRPRIVVLRYENGAFQRTAEFEGFGRVIPHADGRKPLYWQTMLRAMDLGFTAASEVVWDKDKGKIKTGKPLDLRLFSDQLFGYAWGDWTKTGKESFAVLEHGDRIRLYTAELKWKSSEVYGGTKNVFVLDVDRSGNQPNKTGTLQPRLINWRSPQGDRDILLVSENIPDLGIRFQYMKLYKRAEISALAWNGLEMKPVWKIPVEGYLADFGVMDVLGQSAPQLWAAAVGPGNRTVLLAYNLP